MSSTQKTEKIDVLEPYEKNSRTHTQEQIDQVAASIQEFGFLNPVITNGKGMIVAGHCRVMAAKQLGITEVPVVDASHLTEAQVRAYVIADNQLALNAGWDTVLLSEEIKSLQGFDFDTSLIGFSQSELDELLAPEQVVGNTDEDATPDLPETPKTVIGDIYRLGNHRLMCGDSTSIDAVEALMDGKKADMVFTDPPYGVEY